MNICWNSSSKLHQNSCSELYFHLSVVFCSVKTTNEIWSFCSASPRKKLLWKLYSGWKPWIHTAYQPKSHSQHLPLFQFLTWAFQHIYHPANSPQSLLWSLGQNPIPIMPESIENRHFFQGIIYKSLHVDWSIIKLLSFMSTKQVSNLFVSRR